LFDKGKPTKIGMQSYGSVAEKDCQLPRMFGPKGIFITADDDLVASKIPQQEKYL
jgi:hypothetical protein